MFVSGFKKKGRLQGFVRFFFFFFFVAYPPIGSVIDGREFL